MKKFNQLCESIKLTYTNPYFNDDTLDSHKREYRSFLELQHFCRKLKLTAKLLEDFNVCLFYFINEFDDDNKLVQFDFLNTYDQQYILDHKELYDALNEFKNTYIVTIDGKPDSRVIKF